MIQKKTLIGTGYTQLEQNIFLNTVPINRFILIECTIIYALNYIESITLFLTKIFFFQSNKCFHAYFKFEILTSVNVLEL